MAELSPRISPEEYRQLMAQQAQWTHKYHIAAPEDRTYNGIVYHSKAEARTAWTLDRQLQQGQITGWERQVRFPLVVNDQDVGYYTADFVVTHLDATRELIEVKGFFTKEAKFRWRVFLALYQRQWGALGWKITLEQT